MLVLSGLLVGCHADPLGGALEVEITGLRGNAVADVAVGLSPVRTTDANLYEATSDARGRVRFDGLPLQTYTLELVYLERTTSALVTIAGDSLRRESFRIDDLPGVDPEILLDAPPPTVSRGEPVNLSAGFRDDRTPVMELGVRWIVQTPFGKTDVLFDGRPGAFGDVYLDLDSLAVGSNSFSITATDTDGRVARSSFTVMVTP